MARRFIPKRLAKIMAGRRRRLFMVILIRMKSFGGALFPEEL
jgi:hypothetical protein